MFTVRNKDYNIGNLVSIATCVPTALPVRLLALFSVQIIKINVLVVKKDKRLVGNGGKVTRYF